MDNKLIAVLLGAFLAVVLVAGLLVPVVNDAMDDQKTIINNEASTRYSSLYEADVNATVTVNNLTSSEIIVTVGDREYTSIGVSSFRNAIVYSDQLSLIYTPSSGAIELIKYDLTSTVTDLVAPIVVTIQGKAITVTDSSTEPKVYTATAKDWIFIPDHTNGNYEFVLQNANIYLNSIDQVYFSALVSTDNKGFVSGNGDTCTFYQTNESYPVSFLAYDIVDEYTDVINVTMQDYRIDESAGTNPNGSRFVPFTSMVPRSIDAHTSDNNSVLGILSAVPIVVLAAVVASIVVTFRSRY